MCDRPGLWIGVCEQEQIHTNIIIVFEYTHTSRLPEDDLWDGAAALKYVANFPESNVLAKHPNTNLVWRGAWCNE